MFRRTKQLHACVLLAGAIHLASLDPARAGQIPYEVAVDSQVANRIDVYNPQASTGLNTPVETITFVFVSSLPSPAHLVVDSLNGTTPGASVFIDVYFDGFQIQGNDITINSRMFFATPTDPSGDQIFTGAPVGSSNGTTFTAQIDTQYPTISSPAISYDLFGQEGPGWPDGQFRDINAGHGPGLIATGVDYGGGTFVDPTLPIFRFTLSAQGPVPEPSSILLAAMGLAGLIAWGWRRRFRRK